VRYISTAQILDRTNDYYCHMGVSVADFDTTPLSYVKSVNILVTSDVKRGQNFETDAKDKSSKPKSRPRTIFRVRR